MRQDTEETDRLIRDVEEWLDEETQHKRHRADGTIHFLQLDTAPVAGASGSPLFWIEKAETIGLIKGHFPRTIARGKRGEEEKQWEIEIPQLMAIAMPISRAKELLRRNGVKCRKGKAVKSARSVKAD